VILTGMGRDGAAGCSRCASAARLTIGQDEATCAVYGMPGPAVRPRAPVERQLLLPEIAAGPADRPRRASVMTDSKVGLDDGSKRGSACCCPARAGLVFDGRRRDSMGYSIGERLRAHGIGPPSRSTSTEACAAGSAERQRLIDEVTIQETHFFRNPPQMRALRAHVLPELAPARRRARRPAAHLERRLLHRARSRTRSR
jgi:hypothetical protein